MNRTTGTDKTRSTNLCDDVPWSDTITSYDRQHRTIYLRILDACADNASVEEIADLILGIGPILEPVRARNAVRSHIDRANWNDDDWLQVAVRQLKTVSYPPFISARPRGTARRMRSRRRSPGELNGEPMISKVDVSHSSGHSRTVVRHDNVVNSKGVAVGDTDCCSATTGNTPAYRRGNRNTTALRS